MLVGSIIGIQISNNVIAKLGRPSIIVFLLGCVVVISALIVPILEIRDIATNASVRANLFKFHGYCPETPPVNYVKGFSHISYELNSF